jgi:protein SCO1/2
MVDHPAVPGLEDESAAMGDRALWLVLATALACGLLFLLAVLRGGEPTGGIGTASPSPTAGSFLLADVREAPPLELIDPDARPFSLASLGGEQVLVFFGYTHCPDVCPATIGTVGKVLGAVGPRTRAIFVTIDPERDTTTWLSEYRQFLPGGFTALTGTAAQIRTAADAWGVRYARVETGTPDAYSMSHTANVYLVDAAGRLRAIFPFGTSSDAMADVVRTVAASTPVPAGTATPAPSEAAPTPMPSPTPIPAATATAGGLWPQVISTSIWAGGHSPVILALNGESGRLNDTSIQATVQLWDPGRGPVGGAVPAIAVQPPLVDRVSFVATLDIPTPGPWQLNVTAVTSRGTIQGSAAITALDPGATAALGDAAPTVHTPTVADVGGDARAITTDPAPDLRLSTTSTTDALAAHRPFVLVVDSVRFRVSPACGRALVMARYLQDRWSNVTFIHLEPFRYALISETPVLDGDIAAPPIGTAAAAWGVGGSPWGPLSMPWIFVVDGNGIIRAKEQGLVGSDDIDVILALVATGG